MFAFYFSSKIVVSITPTAAPTPEAIIPAINKVDCEISPLIIVTKNKTCKT